MALILTRAFSSLETFHLIMVINQTLLSLLLRVLRHLLVLSFPFLGVFYYCIHLETSTLSTALS